LEQFGRRTRALAPVSALLCLVALAPVAAASDAGTTDGPTATGGSAQQRRDIPLDIVRIARGEFDAGVRELPLGSDDSRRIRVDRSAIAPRVRGPEPWCAIFVSWVTRKAGAPIGRDGAGIVGAAAIESWALRTGRWRHRPQPGDIAVYPGHAGIVESVGGSRMTTIEGNWSNRVSRLHRRQAEAFGFARLADPPRP
jgi:hypothetical protein